MSARIAKELLRRSRLPFIWFIVTAGAALLLGGFGVLASAAVLGVLTLAASSVVGTDKRTYDAVHGITPPAGWAADLAAMKRTSEIASRVLVVSAHPDDVGGPAQMRGRRWPVVVINSEFAPMLSPSMRRAVIAHELAHLRRHDRARRVLGGAAVGLVGGAFVLAAREETAWALAGLAALPFVLLAVHRHCEFGADRMTLSATNDVEAVVDAIWAAATFEATRLGKPVTPRAQTSLWNSPDLLAPHPAPGRRERRLRAMSASWAASSPSPPTRR
jgi:hypothetical protein